jgi:nucleotide-binding universal stress UspA family protein
MTATAPPPLPLHPPLLLATDGSASARLAQQYLYPLAAVLTAPETTANWVTLHVKPRLLPGGDRGGVSQLEKPEPDKNKSEKSESGETLPEWLPELAAEVPSEFKSQLLLRRGRPSSEILHTAKQLGAGLIAVGDHGVETGLRDLLLGSVSNAVAQYANCHVLIARNQKPEPPTAPPAGSEAASESVADAQNPWRHVLLVLDGSQSTPQAIALTRQLIPAGIEQVTLLSIQPPLTTQYLFGPFATPAPSWQLIQSLEDVQKEQSQQMLAQASTALQGEALQITSLSEIAEPGVTICQIAQQQQVNLVIIGSDRRVGLGQVRLGVTGSYLIHHAPCPVLLCRPSHGESGSQAA